MRFGTVKQTKGRILILEKIIAFSVILHKTTKCPYHISSLPKENKWTLESQYASISISTLNKTVCRGFLNITENGLSGIFTGYAFRDSQTDKRSNINSWENNCVLSSITSTWTHFSTSKPSPDEIVLTYVYFLMRERHGSRAWLVDIRHNGHTCVSTSF
jgi:hypothetical protein